jgi:hypothetical protein
LFQQFREDLTQVRVIFGDQQSHRSQPTPFIA